MDHNQRIYLLHSLLNSIVSVRVENVERVPKTGGALIVCNHSDLIDPLVQGLYSGRNLSYLAKAELIDGNPLRRFQKFIERARRMGVPGLVVSILTEVLEVLNQLLQDARILPIVRGYRTGTAAGSWKYYDDLIANVVQLLREGEAVAMYPEGGRSFDGKLKPFRGLAARIAIQAGVPIIPTALVGAYGFSDLNRWISNRRPTAGRSIIYRIGEAIDPADFAAPEAANAAESPNAAENTQANADAAAHSRSAWRSMQNKDAIKALTRRLFTEVEELLQTRPRRPRPRRPAAPHKAPAQQTPDLFTHAADVAANSPSAPKPSETSATEVSSTPASKQATPARQSRKSKKKAMSKSGSKSGARTQSGSQSGSKGESKSKPKSRKSRAKSGG
ncbi:MAG: 1-acyl-sn-glycerol-3-phosphate acyltransferase [bacterium]|nr:1-acyl-sn-glycerol-3-phosphate acyltransferase [bacterium]